MPKVERLDLLVMSRGLFTTRAQARAAIMDGAIFVNGEKLIKPGINISKEAKIEVAAREHAKFKSRGGLKLEKALASFNIPVANRICLDIGASTGGFTDCLLKHGASRVYAIDVGYGQLDWQLRNDQRVVVKERQNARYLSPGKLYEKDDRWADLATIDVSFISLSKILPACIAVLTPDKHDIICLIKPQFETGRERVEKGGVVKSKEIHKGVVRFIVDSSRLLGAYCYALDYSPIKGPKGNIEFLIHLANTEPSVPPKTDEIVEHAHTALNQLLN